MSRHHRADLWRWILFAHLELVPGLLFYAASGSSIWSWWSLWKGLNVKSKSTKDVSSTPGTKP
jgi:hypothetical protein